MIRVKSFFIVCISFILTGVGLIYYTPPTPVSAVGPCGTSPFSEEFLLFPPWYRGLDCDGERDKGTSHVVVTDVPQTIWTVALNILDILLRVVGILAVVMILVSAFQYLTNGGSADKISKAKTTLMQAIVGLVIALLASTIIGFIMAGLS